MSLFITSYIPLFVIIILKQVQTNWEYLCFGGLNGDAIICMMEKFGMPIVLFIIMLLGTVGLYLLIKNLEKNLPNGLDVRVLVINNRNSESLGYLATYIVPFMASNFSSLLECVYFLLIMLLIYVIYINSNMILVNPILNIRYSLLEIEYSAIADEGRICKALIIACTKDLIEDVNYKIYPIGFKLYYGKEQD